MTKIKIIALSIAIGVCLGKLIMEYNSIPTVGSWLLLLLLEFLLQILYNIVKQK